YTTESFDKNSSKFLKGKEDRLKKTFFQIRDNPYVGDQLQYRNLREKRIDEKRIYYLVYDD
ncbi:MAG: hypothetical protein ABEJ02_04840, partial [Candidatus Paceibacteria bacterium]